MTVSHMMTGSREAGVTNTVLPGTGHEIGHETGSETGLYVHWPYCLSKCPYCDFNSHVAAQPVDHIAWTRAFLRTIDAYADRFPGRVIGSVFFGGGTPSLMAPQTVEAILNHVARRWTMASTVEITLEANPGAVDYEKFAAFRDAGVNRVSLGVQSFDDEVLAFLGRRHSAQDAQTALTAAAKLFPRFSLDLIYARPDQSLESWRQELTTALDRATGGHLSLYQLTIEKGTPFEREAYHGRLVLPTDTDARALWDMTQDLTVAHGLPAYEVSNHARPGQESRHNLIYWAGGDYIGIGPGAHGRIRDQGVCYATRQHRAPDIWRQRALNSQAINSQALNSQDGERGSDLLGLRELSSRERAEENVMMGLRLMRGIDPDVFLQNNGDLQIIDILDAERIHTLQDNGLLHPGPTLRLTPAGIPVLDGVLRYLFRAS